MKVRATMTVTWEYDIDLKSDAYEGAKTMDEAIAMDMEGIEADPSLFIESDVGSNREMIVTVVSV